jgi:hypothetical protein
VAGLKYLEDRLVLLKAFIGTATLKLGYTKLRIILFHVYMEFSLKYKDVGFHYY